MLEVVLNFGNKIYYVNLANMKLPISAHSSKDRRYRECVGEKLIISWTCFDGTQKLSFVCNWSIFCVQNAFCIIIYFDTNYYLTLIERFCLFDIRQVSLQLALFDRKLLYLSIKSKLTWTSFYLSN